MSLSNPWVLNSVQVLAERFTLAALKLCYACLSGAPHTPSMHIRGPSGAKIP